MNQEDGHKEGLYLSSIIGLSDRGSIPAPSPISSIGGNSKMSSIHIPSPDQIKEQDKQASIDSDDEHYHNAYSLEGRWCLKRRPHWEKMPDRKIITNVPDRQLPNNRICTSKYTNWNFIPLNLFEQFSKMANVYFLIIGYFETIRPISITDGQPVIWFPLFLVVCISALKDFFEDHKRHVSDEQENFRYQVFQSEDRVSHVLTENGFEDRRWQDVMVGDIIRIDNGEYFPADIAILGGSGPKGQCFIETKNLDGETNLKIRKIARKISYISNLSLFDLYHQRLVMHYERPNPYLYKFEGSLQGEFFIDSDSGFRSSRESSRDGNGNNDRRCGLDSVNFVLRGCSLRNTPMIIGLVAYTGHDTKIMLNSTSARPKRSHLEEIMNFFIILVFFIQIVICLFCAQYNSLWQEKYLKDTDYLELSPDDPESSFFKNLFYKWGTWLLIFTNFVPISLLVTLETVKFLQGNQIHEDKLCQSGATQCVVQSSCLNEELGQVTYIFSDKTGTITKNLMEFKMISVYGKLYGQNQTLSEKDISSFPHVENVDFRDATFFKDLQEGGPLEAQLIDFMIHLGICNTILVVKDENGNLVYNASSPDELALANGAKFCGFQYVGTDEKGFLVIRFRKQHLRFQPLRILEFTSSRKRMSIIVRLSDGTIKLLIKGADTVLEKLLSIESHESILKKKTWQHLQIMAQKGLRTLLFAQRQLSEEEYHNWAKTYEEATLQLADREDAIDKAQARIEVKLELMGATGIEDKLQDEVKETIEQLLRAQIKIWVLTGDKLETAINICYSCGLLSDQQSKIIIDGDTQVHVSYSINQGLQLIESSQWVQCSLVLSGDALIHLVQPRFASKLMQIAKKCRTVICCRVSPKQKQEVVSLVMQYEKDATTLAVGDGANDVNMITAAHIGVGVKGVEGNQAARAADYAIGEFKILSPLLLVHGRECFRRNTVVVGYNFYKNLVVVLPHFWYSFNNGFSATNLYDPWMYQFYNMFYTSMPIILYAVYDAEYSPEFLLRHPQIYAIREALTLMGFFEWFLLGWLQSAVIAYACFPSFEATTLNDSGQMLFLASVGMAVFCYAIIVVNIKIVILSHTYTLTNLLVIIASIIFLFVSYMILSLFTVQLDISKSFFILVLTWNFWGVLAVIIVTTGFIDLGLWRWKHFDEQHIVGIIVVFISFIEDKLMGQQRSCQKSFSCSLSALSNRTFREIRSNSSLEPIENQFQNFIEEQAQEEMKEEEKDDFSECDELLQRPQLVRRYTGYGFAQQEKVLDHALQNAQN